MKKLLILCLTFMIATELEVDGNLKVTGDIDVQNNPIKNVGPPTTLTDAVNGQVLQDALRDDGVYEYKIRFLKSWDAGDSMGIQYFKNDDAYGVQYNGGASFDNDMLTLLNDGYMIFQVVSASNDFDGYPNSIWIYRRLVSDE